MYTILYLQEKYALFTVNYHIDINNATLLFVPFFTINVSKDIPKL